MDDIISQRNTLVDILLDPTLNARHLPLTLFEDITDNFSYERLIGTGGFGQVYKGLLPNGIVVAVKRLDTSAMVDDKSFHAELECMTKLRNKNIVRLLGYCVYTLYKDSPYEGKIYPKVERQERILCMEFLTNGPIQKDGPSIGKWPSLYQTIKGICNGLDYIHHEGYIHFDLKPDNILLDDNKIPKILDFGISRFFGDKNTCMTKTSIGTLGYLPPEYIHDQKMSTKADIYSLGVIIFELLTKSKGPLVQEDTQVENESSVQEELIRWSRILEPDHKERELHLAYQQVETCLRIALSCKDPNRNRRHTAKQISHIVDLALDPDILEKQNKMATMVVKHISSVQDMDLHPSRPWILLSLWSGHIEIINYVRKVSLGTFPLGDKPVLSAKFVEGDGWNIVAGDDSGFLHVCNFEGYEVEPGKVKEPTEVKTIKATRGNGIRYLAVQQSKRYLLISTGSSIMIWNAEDWTCIMMHHGPNYFKTVKHASFNTNDDSGFGIGCCDGTVKLWSHTSLTSTRRPYLELCGHSEQVCSIDYFTCDSETFIVTGSMDKTAKVWKYDRKRSLDYGLASIKYADATLEHEDGVTATCYIPEFKIILTGTDDGVVSVWCSETYRLMRYLCFGLGRIFKLACLKGRRVFIGHEHGLVLVEVDPRQIEMDGMVPDPQFEKRYYY